jgi:hypothetical protein
MDKQEDERDDKDERASKGKDRDKKSQDVELSPSDEKRGERPDNLKRRSDWFRKRTRG